MRQFDRLWQIWWSGIVSLASRRGYGNTCAIGAFTIGKVYFGEALIFVRVSAAVRIVCESVLMKDIHASKDTNQKRSIANIRPLSP